MIHRLSIVVLILCCANVSAQTSSQPDAVAQTLPGLSKSLRAYLLKSLPDPLYKKEWDWGKTDLVPNQIKWKRKGIFLVPKVYRHQRNHGKWKRVTFRPYLLDKTLYVDIRDYKKVSPEKRTFSVVVAFHSHFEYNAQTWKLGSCIWQTNVRARMRALARLDSELTVRWENGKNWIPDAVLQFRVVKATTGYDNLKFDHVPGFGGEVAEIVGNAAHNTLNTFKPSLEQKLFERLNASIIRAAGTREIRLSMSQLFK